MKTLMITVALGSLLAAGAPSASRWPLDVATQSPGAEPFATTPPAAWAQGDPADSVYRLARRALDQKEYAAAARLFETIVSRYPRSEYAPDALYWKGFALYRDGNLDGAADALEAQAQRFPRAATRGDAASLLMVVKGEQAKRGDKRARQDVDSAATQSGRGCQEMEVQIAALDAVQRMDPDRVVPMLRKVLARRDECSLPLRKNALFILAQRGGSDRERILLDIAKNDPSSDMRKDAVFFLAQAKSDLAVDALEDVLLHGNEQSVRDNALFSLAQIRSDRARKILRDFALSDNAPLSLRNDAIFHLAQRREEGDVAWLREAYTKVTDAKVRENILFHIAQRPGVETNKWLASVVVDPKENTEQRKNALFHLSASRLVTAEELGTVYDGTTSASIKKDIIFFLAQSRDPKALDKLIAIAKRDSNIELRKEALFHVGQSKDPRALKALEEIVTP
jgi:HEAT repeat protein